MSVATELRSPVKPDPTPRTILGPAGNRVSSPEKVLREKKVKKKTAVEKAKRSNSETPRKKNSVVVPCSSDGGESGGKKIGNGMDDIDEVRDVKKVLALGSVPLKRCDWITSYSDSLYCSFHDEEWGVPVHNDSKLFELFVLSIALAELTWPAILYKRETFRKHFNNFDPSSIAKFTDHQLLSAKANSSTLLSEPKLRAVVENAKQLLKVQKEFGSFSNYCWKFVNHKPIRNGFRYARQVPAKTPKAELISKDLMQRGFRCVGPTVVYSFMQVSGMVNDHLITCFRFHQCNNISENNSKPNEGEKTVPSYKDLDTTERNA